MTIFGQYAVQKAIHQVLSGDASLMALIDGVYDFVPADTQYPYVTLGDSRVQDHSTVGVQGFRQTLAVHIYSRARGRKEVTDIMARIYELLHETTPAADGHSITNIRFLASNIRLEKDGLTLHGAMQVDVLAEVNA